MLELARIDGGLVAVVESRALRKLEHGQSAGNRPHKPMNRLMPWHACLLTCLAARWLEILFRSGAKASAFLELYPAASEEEARTSQLAAFRDEAAWNARDWALAQSMTGGGRAYLYYFVRESLARAAELARHTRRRNPVRV